MLYSQEFDIRSFKFWAGAEDHINTLRDANLLDEVEQALISIYLHQENLPTDTEINDLVWHDFEYLLEVMNYNECEVCSTLFESEDPDAVTSHGIFCSPNCAETKGINYCNECGSWEKSEYQTLTGLNFCSSSCLENSRTDYFTEQEENAISVIENLFTSEKITIDFLEGRENLSHDEQIAVDAVIEILKSL